MDDEDEVNSTPYGLPGIAELMEAVNRTVNAAPPAEEPPAVAAPAALLDDETIAEPQSAAVSTPEPAPSLGPGAGGFEGLDDLWICEGIVNAIHQAFAPDLGRAAAGLDTPSAEQILRDRPDVMQSFYSEYWGPNNDRHSHAWVDRVGGDTPEDYARYWYDKMGGQYEYTPSASHAAPTLSDDGAAPVGRTTLDGIPLAQILQDRPDVFQAFFTEYYGPNNDRHSSAWDQRVGGHSPEDYANFWYNTGGKLEGYVPSTAHAGAPDGVTDPAGDNPPIDDSQLVLTGQSLMTGDDVTGI